MMQGMTLDAAQKGVTEAPKATLRQVIDMRLDRSRTKHNILPVIGRCYNCGVRLRYTGEGAKDRKYYCSVECMRRRPPKMVLAELYWGEPFESLALRHLNNGGSVQALADMCGVHKQAVLNWLRLRGIERRVMWRKRGEDATAMVSIGTHV